MEKRKLIATAVFVAVVGAVLAVFIVLGMQDHPPDMPPKSAPHELRFNLKGELIGVESDPAVDPLQASQNQPGFVYDQKAVVDRINQGCIACHAMCPPGGAAPGAPPCRGEHHPPKTECIKCHRPAH